MPQPTLLPGTEFKKNYNFVWYIGFDKLLASGMPTKVFSQFRLLMNHPLTSYISQLTEKVSLPDDTIDTDGYDIGPVDMPVPKKIPMPDIRVTYLEDTNDTVYNFHKSWMSFIRQGDTFCMEPLYPYTIIGRYMTYDNTLTAEEHSTILRAQSAIDSKISDSATFQLTHEGDIFMKPKSIYNYPHLIPVGISRGEADKGGSATSRITVTYKRLPEITKSKNYINLSQKQFFVQDTGSRISTSNPKFNLNEVISF